MWNLRACAVCLTTDLKLNDISDGQIRREFNLASGLKTAQCNGMPQYLCIYCTAYVKRFVKFREKCQLAYYTLKEILNKSQEINPHHLQALNRDLLGIKPTLSFMDPKNCRQEEVIFQWVKYNRLNVSQKINIPIIQSTTIEDNMKFTSLENQNNVNKELVFEVPPIDAECIKEESNDLISDNYFDVSNKDKSQTDLFVVQSNVDDTENYFDNYISDNEFDNTDETCKEKKEDRADGSNLEEEYANMIPISMNEAKAVSEVYKLFSNGKFRCQHCNKGYTSKNRLDIHLRMHDKHVSGSYLCELCNYYYKTEFLLKTHMTEKHMYKYLCRKCTEVSYDRVSAKQHFIWSHLQKGKKKNANWYETRPSWLNSKGGKRVKGIVTLKPVRKINKLPDDFPLYSPVSQEEQYLLINERKKTSNYLDSQYKCELCYRGFREMDTYNKHMRKHDPAVSGPVQCDMCKLQFRDARRIYKHMNITHLFKYSCQQCGYVCYNKGQARLHYRWHNNVTYPCPHCKKEFKKMSTRLTHIRIKHPSNFICNICGHSFVSENGLYCHKNLTHTKEEIECSAALSAEAVAVAGAGAEADPLYCGECRVRFSCELAFDTHLGSSNKHAETNLSTKPRKSVTSIDAQRRRPGRGRPRRLRGASEVLNNGVATSSNCELCGKHLSNDVQARRHYQTTHPGAEFPKRYMCDVCGHTTKQYANLMVHMRTHTREKPYSCPHCDRRFSMPSNRDRHLVVHTGEKRYQCQHCNRRFTQSSAVKLHIQTVHLKIPYAPWDKKNRKRRRDQDAPVAPLPPDASAPFPLQPKLVFDSTVDYLNAFITYNDD